MTNPLTGDFDCVLQIGDATLDRLAATMHQNAFTDMSRPTLLHAAVLRIEDSGSNERGSVNAQLGSPRIFFDDGATDHLWVEMKVRAGYWADPGSEPLAEVINGTVRAKYRIRPVDPRCPGWKKIGKDYLRLVVDRASVSFEGAAHSDSEWYTAVVGGQANMQSRITKHLRSLLGLHFAPEPQRVDERFRKFRTLSGGRDRGLSVIAFPIGLQGEVPTGSLSSITNRFLGGWDFGVAINSEYFRQAIQSVLDPKVGSGRDIAFRLDGGLSGGVSVDYHVRLDSIAAQWLPPSNGIGYVHINATGQGWASRLYRSGIYNVGRLHANDLAATFTAGQTLALEFDPQSEKLTARFVGQPNISVSLNYDGLFSGELEDYVRGRLTSLVKDQFEVPAGAGDASVGAIRTMLADGLSKFDGSVTAVFGAAGFEEGGLVVRGDIMLSRRRPPQVVFEKTDTDDGFDAFRSWIPGGFIESFNWTWRWFSGPLAGLKTPGSATGRNTFFLRRPTQQLSAFGGVLGGERTLPGIDGPGRVCLSITGRRVDHITGRLVRIQARAECSQFGYRLLFPPGIAPYVRLYEHDAATGITTSAGLLQLIPSSRDADEATHNTLVVYQDSAWNEEVAAALLSGLAECRRRDAGLFVLVVVPDGVLETPDTELRRQFDRFTGELPAPADLVEDVCGSWSRLLSVNLSVPGTHWRLLAPDCAITWSGEGAVDAETLSQVLNEKLVTSDRPAVANVDSPVEIGSHFTIPRPAGSHAHGPCPISPLTRPNGSSVLFVHSLTGRGVLREALAAGHDGDEPPLTAVVVDGQDSDEWDLPTGADDVVVIPDPTGEITRRAGVRILPTRLVLDEHGRLSDVQPMIGSAPRARESHSEGSG